MILENLSQRGGVATENRNISRKGAKAAKEKHSGLGVLARVKVRIREYSIRRSREPVLESQTNI